MRFNVIDMLTALCALFSSLIQLNALFMFDLQFFTGWWFLIDAISVYPEERNVLQIILGIMGTISLVMVNSVTQAQVRN